MHKDVKNMIRLKKLGFVTQQEAAEILDITRQTVAAWHKRGSLPKPVLVQNGIIVWKLSDIQEAKKIIGGEK